MGIMAPAAASCDGTLRHGTRIFHGARIVSSDSAAVQQMDIRQMLGARVSTWDFVLSQGSGNAALFGWMVANAVWAGRKMKKKEGLRA